MHGYTVLNTLVKETKSSLSGVLAEIKYFWNNMDVTLWMIYAYSFYFSQDNKELNVFFEPHRLSLEKQKKLIFLKIDEVVQKWVFRYLFNNIFLTIFKLQIIGYTMN